MGEQGLTIIIVSWNTRELLKSCLVTLKRELDESGVKSKVVVVDNNSKDGSSDMVQNNFPWVRLIANKENRGFGRANNQVLKDLDTEYTLLLNPDTEVRPGAVRELLAFANSHPKAAVVAPQLLNTDGSVQRSCRSFPSFSGMVYELLGLSRMFPGAQRFRTYKMLDFDHQSDREVDQPEGACLLVRKSAIDEVGIFDEQFFMLFEEVDWCYRFKKAGWEIWFHPAAKVIHHYGQAIKQVKARMIFSSHTGMYLYWKKHTPKKYLVLAPVIYIGLKILAVIRIVILKLKI